MAIKSPNLLVIVLLAFLIWPYLYLLFSPCQSTGMLYWNSIVVYLHSLYILWFFTDVHFLSPHIILAVFYFDTNIFPQKCLYDPLLQHSFAFLHTFSLWLLDNVIVQESTRKLHCLFVYPNRQRAECHVSRSSIFFVKTKSKTFHFLLF